MAWAVIALCRKRRKSYRTTDEEIIRRLEDAMRNERLYLEDISILQAAARIHTNRTYVSKSLNSRGMSFRTYLNNYRTLHAMEMIRKDRKMEYSAEEIARASGFMTERTMNGNLKRLTGHTFSSYRKKVLG